MSLSTRNHCWAIPTIELTGVLSSGQIMRYPLKAGSAIPRITSCCILCRCWRACSMLLMCGHCWLCGRGRHSRLERCRLALRTVLLRAVALSRTRESPDGLTHWRGRVRVLQVRDGSMYTTRYFWACCQAHYTTSLNRGTHTQSLCTTSQRFPNEVRAICKGSVRHADRSHMRQL